MKCANCGAELEEGAKFCVSCGTPVAEAAAPVETPLPQAPDFKETVQQPVGQQAAPVSMKKSIWALILGCCGLGSFWTGFIGPVGIISIVISIVGLIIGGKAKKENPGNKMGKTGWILSLIGLIVSAILTIICTIIFAVAANGYSKGYFN